MIKKSIFYIAFLATVVQSYSQLLPGTLDVSGFPNMVQSIDDLVTEAGEDDGVNGFESEDDATLIGFKLDPTLTPFLGFVLVSSSQKCSANIFRYSVYMHTNNAPANTVIEAKTYFNSGNRFPAVSPYDSFIVQPLGPRDLTPENGGNYIAIPNDGSVAVKVMEFIGCREDVPIQFRVKPTVKSTAGISNLDVVYTVVGSQF